MSLPLAHAEGWEALRTLHRPEHPDWEPLIAHGRRRGVDPDQVEAVYETRRGFHRFGPLTLVLADGSHLSRRSAGFAA